MLKVCTVLWHSLSNVLSFWHFSVQITTKLMQESAAVFLDRENRKYQKLFPLSTGRQSLNSRIDHGTTFWITQHDKDTTVICNVVSTVDSYRKWQSCFYSGIPCWNCSWNPVASKCVPQKYGVIVCCNSFLFLLFLSKLSTFKYHFRRSSLPELWRLLLSM